MSIHSLVCQKFAVLYRKKILTSCLAYFLNAQCRWFKC